ncbi:STAS domain-containing protein [Mycobacterium xenopi]|uniref:Sulfate transporter n=1 Tax=Mycobacterium xenopi TaxID=1789 RepID=A0AAD1H1E3_MYCXE|nr:STAS domain-containing protein [Mycobacterium xenopi]EID14363.1 STAS domain-containing protein [Mycobacterium xenopi RIVM700367]MDA3641692.1 STAS domain-containing protein [Mycobacterium xenopi]MDA3660046.1 STAS domain-containing protein [Mycobacterium xenopi]MDA3663918.1 STAS domain-containing protein [Mycobacterium xenopi]ORX13016.1 sulfate transporter [Mycobacterium xenopi]
MTGSTKTVADLTPRRRNPVIDCGGARIRAQQRHLATVVTISGVIDAANVDRVSDSSRRFILADSPFILDLSGVDCLAAQAVFLLHRVDHDCCAARVEWALVPSHAVRQALWITNDDGVFPVVDSVHEALRYFADAIVTRRRLLLPLLTKSA